MELLKPLPEFTGDITLIFPNLKSISIFGRISLRIVSVLTDSILPK